jgi:hypothetical protein
MTGRYKNVYFNEKMALHVLEKFFSGLRLKYFLHSLFMYCNSAFYFIAPSSKSALLSQTANQFNSISKYTSLFQHQLEIFYNHI